MATVVIDFGREPTYITLTPSEDCVGGGVMKMWGGEWEEKRKLELGLV